MKKTFLTFCTALCASTALSAPAYADIRDERIRALEEQVQIMADEIKALKAEHAAEKSEKAALEEKVDTIAANIAPAAGEEAVDVDLGPGPKITKGDFSWQAFGRVQLDAAAFNDDKTDHPDGAEFRRARLGMKGQVSKDVGYKVEVDFANEGVAFKDVYLNYTGIDDVELRAGNFKPPMGLEEMTSGNDITFIERSAATSAFATGEIIGAGALTHGDNWSAAAGIFNDDAGVQSSDDEAISVAARGTWAPVLEEDKTVHLGLSATHRKPDSANDTFDFDAKAENAIQSVDSVSAVITTASDAQIYGAEAAAVWGPVSAQGEYFHVNVDNSAGADPSFNGGYAQLSWLPTGERRPYNAKTGTFGRIVPDKPLNPATGDWGAVELAARYSRLDLTDGPVSGGEMDIYTAGINWYLYKNARLMLNYIMADTDSSAPTPDDDPQLLLLRAQVDF